MSLKELSGIVHRTLMRDPRPRAVAAVLEDLYRRGLVDYQGLKAAEVMVGDWMRGRAERPAAETEFSLALSGDDLLPQCVPEEGERVRKQGQGQDQGQGRDGDQGQGGQGTGTGGQGQARTRDGGVGAAGAYGIADQAVIIGGVPAVALLGTYEMGVAPHLAPQVIARKIQAYRDLADEGKTAEEKLGVLLQFAAETGLDLVASKAMRSYKGAPAGPAGLGDWIASNRDMILSNVGLRLLKIGVLDAGAVIKGDKTLDEVIEGLPKQVVVAGLREVMSCAVPWAVKDDEQMELIARAIITADPGLVKALFQTK